MKQFNPSELQSAPFNELIAGQCFWDTRAQAWTAVFALASDDGDGQRFLVPFGGDHPLIAVTFRPDAGFNGIKRVIARDVREEFAIRFDSEPVDNTELDSHAPLLITRSGPVVHSHAIRNPSAPMRREGFLLNFATFECDFAGPHEMELADAPAIERWSLVLKDELNRGTVFFQHQPALRPALA